MFDNLHSLSIEKFAAFLDGNLPSDEMYAINKLACQESMVHDLVEASENIEISINEYSASDIHIPEEILSEDFKLPNIIDNSQISSNVLECPVFQGLSFSTSDVDKVASVHELVALRPEESDMSSLSANDSEQWSDEELNSDADTDSLNSFDEL